MLNTDKKGKSEHSIIFLHIPKTAGTTLHGIIEKQYEKNSIFSIGTHTQKRVDEFKSLSQEEREKIRVIKGHTSFGLHEFMPQPCTYITMLRDPIERVISSYYYVIRTPIHYLYESVTTKQLSLKDFVNSGISTDLDNGQTRRLAGASAGALLGSQTIGFGDCSVELLEIAKKNLNNYFSIVGTCEKFDEFLLLAKHYLGWGDVYYSRQNVTKKRPLKEQVSDDVLEIIQKHNYLDIQLYEMVQNKFEQRIRQLQPHFDRELMAFRVANSVYSKFSDFSALSRTEMIKLKSSVKRLCLGGS